MHTHSVAFLNMVWVASTPVQVLGPFGIQSSRFLLWAAEARMSVLYLETPMSCLFWAYCGVPASDFDVYYLKRNCVEASGNHGVDKSPSTGDTPTPIPPIAPK